MVLAAGVMGVVSSFFNGTAMPMVIGFAICAVLAFGITQLTLAKGAGSKLARAVVVDGRDDARVTAARTDINNLMQALKLYRLDNQRYPTAEQGLQALLTRPTTGPAAPNWKPYVEKLPNDPWGHPYQYMNPGIKGEIDVLSFGADGQSGGEAGSSGTGAPRRNQPPRHPSSGFTLLELIVVIAIIAVATAAVSFAMRDTNA
eukprot:gene57752-77085_t